MIALVFVFASIACALAIALFLTVDKLQRTRTIAYEALECAREAMRPPHSRAGLAAARDVCKRAIAERDDL